jgi:hypothetical protein
MDQAAEILIQVWIAYDAHLAHLWPNHGEIDPIANGFAWLVDLIKGE